MKMNISQDMEPVMSMDVKMTMSMDITDVTEGVYESDMTIASMNMEMSQAGNKMSFDSEMKDDELDEAGKMLKSQMGGLMSAVISAKGNNLGEVLETKVEPNVPGASDMMNQSGNMNIDRESGNPINSLVNMEMIVQGQKMSTTTTTTMLKK